MKQRDFLILEDFFANFQTFGKKGGGGKARELRFGSRHSLQRSEGVE